MSERATLSTIDGQAVLRFERRLRHSPAKVWRAVSDPAEMTHWFPAAVETELRPGAPIRFTFPEEDDVWDGEVLEVDPPKVYVFRWSSDVLRIELIPDGDGCLLVFTHTLGGGEIGRLTAGRAATGWDTCLDVLVARLDGRTTEPREDWLTPIESYVEEFGLGEGTASATGDGFELHFARDLIWTPPEQVWSKLTEDGELGDTPPVRATNGYVPAGRLVHANAPHELTYEWLHDGEPAGTVTWRIFSDKQLGVRVELTQTVPAHLAEVRATAMAAWHVQLELFFAAVHGDIRCPWPEARTEELAKHYTAKL
jgi:uncharacterized protein YndB with AHSA1/START domain